MAVDLARETALKVLHSINEKGAYSNIVLGKYMDEAELRDIDRAFVTELVYGVVKWKLTLDWIVGSFSKVRQNKLSPWISNILRLGTYQLIFTDRIPQSAACNESVKLARKYGHAASAGFVNGVLRNIARNKENIAYPDREREYVKYLSVKHSHPEWMVEEWLGRFGREFTESLLQSNNQVPQFTVRVNRLKTGREELMDSLRSAGFSCEEGKYAGEAVIIDNPGPLAKMELFNKGYFQVQDESSMLVAKLLDPRPGELVMDVCSAPGGKTTHIAELMENRGRVLAWDIHEHKVKIVQAAAKRLGLDIIEAELKDGAREYEELKGRTDRVLVDAPCTGLGIIRKKPDIKWSRDIGDKAGIIRLQAEILKAAASHVKSGGVLVYSTCTIEPEENEGMIKQFLGENPGFRPEDISGLLPAGLAGSCKEKGFIQLFPNIHGVDGFFIAKMVKIM